MRISDWSSDVCSSDLGSTVSVQLAATDPDGPVDALRWTLVAAPAGATLSETGLLTWFAADGDATADFRVRVADAEGAVAEGTFTVTVRSEEHTSELQSLMRISYAVFCLKKKKKQHKQYIKHDESSNRT